MFFKLKLPLFLYNPCNDIFKKICLKTSFISFFVSAFEHKSCYIIFVKDKKIRLKKFKKN